MENQRIGLLLMWLVIPILIIGNKKTGVWWYHLDLLYPSQFIFIAIALLSLPSLAFIPAGAQKGLTRASFSLLLAVVLFQGYFLIAWQQRVNRHGEIAVDASKLWIGSASPPFGSVVLLPLGYRSGILRALLEDFGVDEGIFPKRFHGAILGPPEARDNIDRLLIRYLASQIHGNRGKQAIPSAHYLVTKDVITGSGLHPLRSKRIGPYLLVEYQPVIDYQSWSYAVVSRRALNNVPEQGWKRLELPAVNIGLDLREGEVFLCRGILRIPSTRQAVKVAVSVVVGAPVKVIGLQINGRNLAPASQLVWESPSFS